MTNIKYEQDPNGFNNGNNNTIIGAGCKSKFNNCVVIGVGIESTADFQLIVGNNQIQATRQLTDEEYKTIRNTLFSIVDAKRKR